MSVINKFICIIVTYIFIVCLYLINYLILNSLALSLNIHIDSFVHRFDCSINNINAHVH